MHQTPSIRLSSVLLGILLVVAAFATGAQSAQQYVPTDFSVNNPTYSGNPFDVLATATFVHGASGETRTTGMFYAGGTTWKFRFTGTRSGLWTYTTSSSDPDLNGRSGQVTVDPAPSNRYGFVMNVGNKWVRPKGPDGTLTAFVPQYVMYADMPTIYSNPAEVDADIQTFFVQHGFTGFHVGVNCGWFDLYTDSYDTLPMDPNPDFRTFEALEMLINKAQDAGGVVHIWAWGDESRHMTPYKWGVNGTVDQRLQRYIAARLGPLPNWTMGYGFDLWEWTTEPQLAAWHDYMQQHMGWKHYLGARNFQQDPWVQLSEALDYSSYEQWRPDYDTYVQTLEDRPTKPSFSEDRFRIRDPSPYPEKDYTEEMTRRGLWHSAMAGGVANIWGNLVNSPADGSSAPYPHPQWIRTYATFFENRFLLSMFRDNTVTNGVCLRTPDSRRFVFYRENTNYVTMNLSAMPAAAPVVAVDTKLAYQNISLGTLQPGQHNWTAPYVSDWAIAVDGTISPSVYCLQDSFTYANGTLVGQGGWSGSATSSQIELTNNMVRLHGGSGSADAIKATYCSDPGTGYITVTAKVYAGTGGRTIWNLWIDDTANKNLARWYGTANSARGRIGITASVTSEYQLAAGWNTLKVRIHVASNTSQFFFNGVDIGTLSHASEGAGDVVGKIRLERIDNGDAVGHFLYFDDFSIGEEGPDVTPPGPVTNFIATAGNGQNVLTWTNPASDYAGTMIRFSTAGFPGGPTGGSQCYNGTGTSFTHTGLTNGVACYYSAFAYDAVPNYSSAATASATPFAPLAYCFRDEFNYANGALNGNGGWTGNATASHIEITGGYVRIFGGPGTYYAVKAVNCGVDGSGNIWVRCKVNGETGDSTMWSLRINDSSGNNFARWYGCGTTARGRIGDTASVTGEQNLSGAWQELAVRINPAADTSEFFFDGNSIGTLSHSSQGAGSSVGQLRFERIDNNNATSEHLYFDDIRVGG